MILLSIFNNETFLLVAETLIIVIGSMLLGILLCYINSWGLKSKYQALNQAIEEERQRTADVVNRLSEVQKQKSSLADEIEANREKIASQAKIIYDHQLKAQRQENEYQAHKTAFDTLNKAIDSYEQRIKIIQKDLEKSKPGKKPARKLSQPVTTSISFEHVSKLIGRQVTENDLTLVLGVGPKTAELLQSHGVDTWEKLSSTSEEDLKKWLEEAGGIYKTQDPTSWARQARMASLGEWRKLRVYQEKLRNQK